MQYKDCGELCALVLEMEGVSEAERTKALFRRGSALIYIGEFDTALEVQSRAWHTSSHVYVCVNK